MSKKTTKPPKANQPEVTESVTVSSERPLRTYTFPDSKMTVEAVDLKQAISKRSKKVKDK